MCASARFATAAAVSTLILVSEVARSAQTAGEELTDSQISSAIHATRLDYSEFESPEAVTVITQEDIRRAGYLEVSEIFRSVPGFRIVKIGDESRLSYHGTTARQNRRMLVTIDGRNVMMSDGQYIEFDRLPIDFEDIARVTITRGPNGAAYGDNAFLVSIDFRTIGRADPNGTSVRVGGGSNDRERYSVSSNQQFGEVSVSFTAARERDGGYDYADTVGTPRNDGKDIKRGRLGIEYGDPKGSRWRLDANAYDSEHGVGSRTVGLEGTQENDGQFFALSNQRELGESSRLDWFVSHNRQSEWIQHRGCYTPETLAGWRTLFAADPRLLAMVLAPTMTVPRVLGTSLADTCFFTDIEVLSRRTEFEIEFESRQGSWRYLLGASGSQTDAESRERFAGMDQRQRSKRVFAETAYSIGKVHLSAGGMAQDADNVDRTEYAGRGALNWQFVPNQMVRYSSAHSFRIPSLIETSTFWTGSFQFGRAGEPDSSYLLAVPLPLITATGEIRPETIDSHAIGYYGSFLRNRATIDAKVFHDTVHSPVELGAFYFDPPATNNEGYVLSGFETEISYALSERWRAGGQYSYLDNDATNAFERSLHGTHGSSAYVSFQPRVNHMLTVSYYGNSTISGNSYDRYDFVYNFSRSFGAQQLRFQFVYQRHVGGIDGIKETDPRRIGLQDIGVFSDLNQFFAFAEYTF